MRVAIRQVPCLNEQLANAATTSSYAASVVMVKNKESKAKLRFVLPFKTKDFTKTLENYMSELKERASKLKEEKKKK